MNQKPQPPAKSDNSQQQAAIIEQLVLRVSFQSDGTGTRELSERILVPSEAGVQALGVLSLPYTSSSETLDVDYVRVRKPDGTVVATPAYNIQDMPADVTRVAPMYSDIHEKHIVVKGLGVGDTLEYALRFHIVKPEIPGQFWFEYTFPKNLIAKDEQLQVSVPRDKYVKVSSPDLKPEVKDDGPTRTYSWKTSNLQVEDTTNESPRRETPPPSVQITSFRTWEDVGQWYSQLQAPQAAVTPAIRAKAEELTKGLTTDDARIRALYNYVATQFHYISLSFGIGRYQPHAAEDVLGNEYGDCKDKHTLLAALLKAAGFDAYPALINSSRKLDPDVPSPAQFDHVITAVPRGNSLQWLDTTSEVAPFGVLTPNLRDKQALLMPTGKPAALVTTPADLPFPTSEVFVVDAKLGNDDILTGHIQRTSRGDVELLYRIAFRQVPQAQWKTLAQRLSYAAGFAGDVSNVTASTPEDTSRPFQFAYDYTRKDFGDWPNRRITPPMPPLGVEARSDNDKKPTEPIVLGAPGEIVYRTRVELPGGYHPKLPASVDLTTAFADYHSTYALKDNVLTAERRLILKKYKIPVDQWEAYRKFGKSIADDEDNWVALNGNDQSEGDYASRTPETERLFQEGYDALQKRDMTTAAEDFRRLIQMNPKYPYAHANLGVVLMMQNNTEDGMAELRKEEELNPDNEFSYRTLALALMRQRRSDEALEQWRKLLKVNPKNRDAALNASGMLIAADKYPEAVSVLEDAAKLAPDSQVLQMRLGIAYLKNKQADKGVPLLEKLANPSSDSEVLNDIGYELADANIALDQALAYAEKAVSQTEARSLLFSASSPEALKITNELAAYWDTLGWVYFRRGDLTRAEAYLRPAWEVSQWATIGDHLAQLYERQGKKAQAEHIYLLALAASHGDKEISAHYEQLTGKKWENDPPVLRRRGAPPAKPAVSPEEELSRVRSVKVSAESNLSGSATYDVAFSPGKTDEVAYISGDTSLKSVAARLTTTKFNVPFPSGDAVKLVRRGILMCSTTGCDFVLYLPQDATADAMRSGR